MTLTSKNSSPDVFRIATTKGLGAWTAGGLARVGVYSSREACLESGGKGQGTDPEILHAVSQFKSADSDVQGAKAIA